MAGPFLIIDLEATCWQGQEKEDHLNENEIIEIGLAVVSPANELLWNGGWFVRPLLNPQLSDFCRRLTSISQEDVDGAEPLKTVLKDVALKVKELAGCALSDGLFVSWGNYDRNQFGSDCVRLGLEYPFGPHVNLKQEFSKKHNLKRAGLPAALSALGLRFEGTHHRGADDAHNIARIFMQDFGADYPFRLREARPTGAIPAE